MKVDHVSGTLSLASLPAGKYIAKIQGNATNMVRVFQVK